MDENGLVTMVKPGTAVIKATANDGSKQFAQVTLNVIYLDPSAKLALTGEIPQMGLEPGQSAQLTLNGSMAIDSEHVIFAVPSNQSAMGSVDETGLFTAGETAGKVTVTAALRSDPLGRKASITVSVIPAQAHELKLTPVLNVLGQITQDGENPMVIFSADGVADGYTFDLTAHMTDSKGNALTGKSVCFKSTDTSIAKVAKDGRVTLAKKADGLCAIEAAVKDNLGTTSRVWISVRNYAPRLESNRIPLNVAMDAGASLGLVESYGNEIRQVQLSDDRFACSYEDNQLTVTAGNSVRKGNYPTELEVTCADGQVYVFKLTVKVTSTLPRVTVKQQGKLNLFYKDSSAELLVTAAGAVVEAVELTDTPDFRLEEENGQWKLSFSAPESVPAKPDKKGTLWVWLEGYREPVTVSLNIAAAVTAPSVKFSTAASTVNTALSSDMSAYLELLDKTGKPLELESPYVWTDTENVMAFWDGSKVVLTLEEPKAVSTVIFVQDSGWAMSLKLTHRITVSDKMPTLKPAGKLTLNSTFPARTAETGFVLSQRNLTLSDMTFVPAAKAGSAALAESEKLEVRYDAVTGHVLAEIKNPGDAPKAGTYSFSCTGTLETGDTFPGGTLRITVSAAEPKVKLSASSVKLNRYLAAEEEASVQITAPDGYQVTDLEGMPEDYLRYDAETGTLIAALTDGDAVGGSYTLYPVVRDVETGEEVTLSAKLTFKVQTYYSEKLAVSISAKGKLDTQSDSEILYTVTRLTNCLSTVDNVTLEGTDKNLFQAEMDIVDGKPAVRLTLVNGETYATNKTYSIQFRFYAGSTEILSAVQKVKVTQTALKVMAPKTLTYYQSQSAPLRCSLTASVPLEEVRLSTQTAKEFQAALGELRVNGNRVEFEIANPGTLKAGKSYSVVLEAIPENNAENVKPITVRLTVKAAK